MSHRSSADGPAVERPPARHGEKARRVAYVTTMHSPYGNNQSIRADRSRPFALPANSGRGRSDGAGTDGEERRGRGRGDALGDRSAWDTARPPVGGRQCQLTSSVNVNACTVTVKSAFHQSWLSVHTHMPPATSQTVGRTDGLPGDLISTTARWLNDLIWFTERHHNELC